MRFNRPWTHSLFLSSRTKGPARSTPGKLAKALTRVNERNDFITMLAPRPE